jgi:hypothetical protein
MTVTETRRAQREGRATRRAGAFDIRTFIALLIGFYGVVLVLTGLLGTSEADLERAGGLNVNLLAGTGMLVAAAAFVVWARMRPVVVAEDSPAEDDTKNT